MSMTPSPVWAGSLRRGSRSCCGRHLGFRGSGGGCRAPRLGSGSPLPLPLRSLAAAPPIGGVVGRRWHLRLWRQLLLNPVRRRSGAPVKEEGQEGLATGVHPWLRCCSWN